MCFLVDPSPVRRVPIPTGIQRKLNFVSVRTIKGSSSSRQMRFGRPNPKEGVIFPLFHKSSFLIIFFVAVFLRTFFNVGFFFRLMSALQARNLAENIIYHRKSAINYIQIKKNLWNYSKFVNVTLYLDSSVC